MDEQTFWQIVQYAPRRMWDHTFSDFRSALISRARRAFETALSDLDTAHRAYD
jgi:hypothetical protein